MTSEVKPYRIHVSDTQLEDVRKRLESTRFPNDLSDSGSAQGAPLKDIQGLHKYWLESYDWRTEESRINETLPQFSTSITVDDFDSLEIHFVHATSKNPNAIPLLFCHGWPGSFLEVSKILPDLINPSDNTSAPAFHVVAPSLPGFGFSEGATKKGFGLHQCAKAFHILMQRLGYPQYVTQAGDWGYVVTRMMGMYYPESCKASHLNFFVPGIPKPWTAPGIFARLLVTPWTKQEREGIARARWYQDEADGYYKQQSTRPQTLAYGLTDSPVGLLSWIYEKLIEWVDDYKWTPDEVLTWVSIYWFAKAGPVGGLRLYYEGKHGPGGKDAFDVARRYVPNVKLGLSRFPKELVPLPMKWNSLLGPVVFEKEHDKGGHFAAWERPDDIVADVRAMFGKSGGAFGVVQAKSGFQD